MHLCVCVCVYDYECHSLVCVCDFSRVEAVSPVHAVLIEKCLVPWGLKGGGGLARGQTGDQAPKKEVTSIFIALDMHM